jgi:hypothetical protein
METILSNGCGIGLEKSPEKHSMRRSCKILNKCGFNADSRDSAFPEVVVERCDLIEIQLNYWNHELFIDTTLLLMNLDL